jgi:hypothetical protein
MLGPMDKKLTEEQLQEKYIYISIPREQYNELKHYYYEAPSSFLRVYDVDVIEQQAQEIERLKIENEVVNRRGERGMKPKVCPDCLGELENEQDTHCEGNVCATQTDSFYWDQESAIE